MKNIVRTQIRLDADDYKMLKKLAYLKRRFHKLADGPGVKNLWKKTKDIANADIV
jgi:hypothetical protein